MDGNRFKSGYYVSPKQRGWGFAVYLPLERSEKNTNVYKTIFIKWTRLPTGYINYNGTLSYVRTIYF